MALIARYSGWSEHFILWELPLSRAYAYAHAYMRLHGIKTVRPDSNSEISQKFTDVLGN